MVLSRYEIEIRSRASAAAFCQKEVERSFGSFSP